MAVDAGAQHRLRREELLKFRANPFNREWIAYGSHSFQRQPSHNAPVRAPESV